MKRRWMTVTGSTAVGAALVLTGCGAETGDGGGVATKNMSATQALTQVSQKTGKADTFRADLTVRDTKDGGAVKASGQFRLRPTLEFTARLDEFGLGGGAMSGVKGQAVYTGDVLYAKVPQLARFVAGGKPWLKVDANQIKQTTGFDVSRLVEKVRQVDPAEQTKMFTGSKDVRRVGTESIDGVSTTRYSGTVTVEEALKRLDPQTRAEARKHVGGNGAMTFDLWVDGDNLPRKLVTKGAGQQGSGTIEVRYRDFGKAFSVNPPPAGETGELSLNGLLGGLPRN